MTVRLKSATLRILFKDPEAFAQVLRHAIAHADSCIRSGRSGERYDALGRHSIWFTQAETPSDWLDLLWLSTSSEPELRLALLDILNRVIGSMPGLSDEPDDAVLDAPYFSALIICRFVRHNHVIDLLPALRARAFGPKAWLRHPELRAAILLAVYANITSVESFEFLDHLARDGDLLDKLDYAQFSVFCAEYITSATRRLMTLNGTREDHMLQRRLDALEQHAWRVNDRPAQPVPSADGFGRLVCEAIDESILGIELPVRLGEAIEALKERLMDPQSVEISERESHDCILRISDLGRKLFRQGDGGAELPSSTNASPPRTRAGG